jgi:hypothetical protein
MLQPVLYTAVPSTYCWLDLCRVTIKNISLQVWTRYFAWHFICVAACLVYHLSPLHAAIQDCSLLAKTGLIRSVWYTTLFPSTNSTVILYNFLLAVRPTFPTSYCLLDSCPLILHVYIYTPIPVPNTSPWSWREQGPLVGELGTLLGLQIGTRHSPSPHTHTWNNMALILGWEHDNAQWYPTNNITCSHNLEDLNLNLHCCENLKSCIIHRSSMEQLK